MTAVEWLVSQLNKQGFAQVVTDEEINQAKELELEKLKEAFSMGRMNKSIKEFNETFKNTNK